MNKYIAVLVTLLLSTMTGVTTWGNTPHGSEAKARAMMPTKLWGTVVSYDAAKNQLTIKDRHEKTHELQLAADSKLTKGGNNEKIAGKDLRAGISVAVIVEGNAAKSVHWNVNVAKVGRTAQAKKK